MKTQKAYVVMSEDKSKVLTDLNWIGLRMEAFKESDLYDNIGFEMHKTRFESISDDRNTIQLFESPEKAKLAVAEIRKIGEIEIGKVKLVELEVSFSSNDLEDL